MNFDLLFAWNWEFDADFARLLETACSADGVSLLQVTPDVLESNNQSPPHSAPENRRADYHRLMLGELDFRSFFDRASDTDARFLPLVDLARQKASIHLNRFDLARRAWNKMTCHLDFITAGLQTPYTIIIPSHREQTDLPPIDLTPLGSCFSLKPAHGGGGDGVFNRATTWEQVLHSRQQYPEDQYLLQAYIEPVRVDGRAAWFRPLFCLDKVYPCWWDTHTHIYTPVTPLESETLQLRYLEEAVQTIARVTQLDLFSTEIALTNRALFIVVDYLNDPLDLRLKSNTPDGIPDEIVIDIAARIAAYVAGNPSFAS